MTGHTLAPASAKGKPSSQYTVVTTTSSTSSATTRHAQSRPNRPGTTRRSGFTAKSVMATMNCAKGLRNGTRNSCIMKRSNTAITNRLPSV